jgi:dTMP kinase
MNPGKFISIEGIEGVGKSTNIKFIASLIEKHGHNVIVTREPGGTIMAEKIRSLLLEHENEHIPDIAELLLFFAARSFHLNNLIKKSLEDGAWVICDRFSDATKAYQGWGRGLNMDMINDLSEWVNDGLKPHLTLILDAPVDIALERTQKRKNKDRMESEPSSFFENVRAGYLEIASKEPDRCCVINAAQSLKKVQNDVNEAMKPIFLIQNI